MWTVDPSGGGDATTIKGGLNLASDGDTVSVLAGTYDVTMPPLTMKAGVMVIGPGIGDGILDDDPLRAVIFSSNLTDPDPLILFSGLTNSAILEGFEIKNRARVGDGGAVLIENGGGIIQLNLIRNNAADLGGALALIMSTALVDGNFIRDNFSSSFGGGVFIDGGAPFLINNIIDNNDASGNRGGGVYIKNSSVEITHNAINGNGAINLSPRLGGGIYVECTAAGQPLISNNIFSNNRFGGPADTGTGSAIYIETACSSYAFTYNNVFNNIIPQLGGDPG